MRFGPVGLNKKDNETTFYRPVMTCTNPLAAVPEVYFAGLYISHASPVCSQSMLLGCYSLLDSPQPLLKAPAALVAGLSVT